VNWRSQVRQAAGATQKRQRPERSPTSSVAAKRPGLRCASDPACRGLCNTGSASLARGGAFTQLLGGAARTFEVKFLDADRYQLRYRDTGGVDGETVVTGRAYGPKVNWDGRGRSDLFEGQLGVEPPQPNDYPQCLRPWLRRHVSESTVGARGGDGRLRHRLRCACQWRDRAGRGERGIGLGSYGLEDGAYTELLIARWFELTQEVRGGGGA
jgi:hypothetical protein